MQPVIKAVSLLAFGAALAAGPLCADTIEGVWQTQPDRKGGYAHISSQPCGAAFCGTVIRAYNADGNQIVTPAVGRKVFWDVKPGADGIYYGRAWVPAFNSEYDGQIQMLGGRMKVSGCFGPVCKSQMWSRIR